MVSQQELDEMYMGMARDISKRSRARRKKVGALLVVPDQGRFEGWNGTPNGLDNNCENEEPGCEHQWRSSPVDTKHFCALCKAEVSDLTIKLHGYPKAEVKLVTKQEVVHAEVNAIAKVAISTSSSKGGTLYCTLSPCVECAKLIIQSKISRVVYGEQYPYLGHNGPVRAIGLELLRSAGIQVDKLELTCQNISDKELQPSDEGRLKYGDD